MIGFLNISNSHCWRWPAHPLPLRRTANFHPRRTPRPRRQIASRCSRASPPLDRGAHLPLVAGRHQIRRAGRTATRSCRRLGQNLHESPVERTARCRHTHDNVLVAIIDLRDSFKSKNGIVKLSSRGHFEAVNGSCGPPLGVVPGACHLLPSIKRSGARL